jgi:putative SOS response-associated peptidase YedK
VCGRFSQFKEFREIRLRFDPDALGADWDGSLFLHPRYNIAPSQMVPVIARDGSKRLGLKSWGLVPSWAKNRTIGQKMINARAETLGEKPSFKRLLFTRRCIVPATGFYEWAKDGKRKVPIYFRMKDGGLFGFAGLWDLWKSPDGPGGQIESFTIITTAPNELIARVHDRMPAILKRDDETRWLDPRLEDGAALGSMLQPYPAGEMEGYEVSRAVNSPLNHGPECIAPVDDDRQVQLIR